MSILIQNVILDGEKRDIYVRDGKIEKIAAKINKSAAQRLEGKGKKAVLPGLVNCHTHSVMTLFRGLADDLPLKDWLDKIWPLEQRLTKDDVYWGTKLAILEMLKTGTTCFNDMYWCEEAAVEAAEEMGIRAVIGLVLLDGLPWGSKEHLERYWRLFAKRRFNTITFSMAPHAIYTVSKENLIWARDFAKEHNLILHTHIAETAREVKECQEKYGLRPLEFLDKIGLVSDKTVLAHSVWLSQKEIKLLAERRGSAVYCPCSNMKLAVGAVFPYPALKKAGANIALGTDGPASNNNLDLFEEMKIGSLGQKQECHDAAVARADEVLVWATKNGARALKIDSGELTEGKLADLILIDLDEVSLVPGHNLASALVYSASGQVVSDVVCHGRILMRDRKVQGENQIIQQARERAKRLLRRA